MMVCGLMLFFISACGHTRYTKCFRFEENISQEPEKANTWEEWRQLNNISDVFGHWNISLAVYSMLEDYPGERAGAPIEKEDDKGENRFRTEIFNENSRNPIHWIWKDNHMETDRPILDEWIDIDTVYFVFLPSEDSTYAILDSAAIEEPPLWIWRFGIAYPFKLITIPSTVDKLRIEFTARLFREREGMIADTTIRKEMVRYESKSKGDYWWNRRD
ncbi:hypothetical protein TRIP_C20666 [Candidatus Zixiibacteriota bacterium]|nr:hypothetical protein TRIP_C20666 [candidate division Zixibacteria bacterium]